MTKQELIQRLQELEHNIDNYSYAEEVYVYGVIEAIKAVNAYKPTSSTLKKAAAGSGIITEKWGAGHKKAHLATYAAPAIASLANVQTEVKTENGAENVYFFGFDTDVRAAMFLQNLTHAFTEAQWEATKNSTEYALAARNKRIQMRPAVLRRAAVWARKALAEMASGHALHHSGGKVDHTTTMEKRQLMAQMRKEISKRAA